MQGCSAGLSVCQEPVVMASGMCAYVTETWWGAVRVPPACCCSAGRGAAGGAGS